MAEIPGATMDWTDYSAPGTPRILNIPDGVGDVTVQDIWDTYSAEAAKVENLVYKKLINRSASGGKGELSVTKSTGITLQANNVRVKFFDQPGPTWVIKRVIDGNLIAVDHLGSPMEAIESSAYTNWKNEADVSAAIVETATSGLTPTEAAQLTSIETDVNVMAADHELIDAVMAGSWYVDATGVLTERDTVGTIINQYQLKDVNGNDVTDPALAYQRVRIGP